jgi:hypothetical protein
MINTVLAGRILSLALLDRLQADRSEKTSSDTPTGNLN